MSSFAKNVAITTIARMFNLVTGIARSVIIARLLGPERKGLYSLALLLPSLVLQFGNLGIASATTYHAAQRRYPRREIFGNNMWLGLVLGLLSTVAGALVALRYGESVFPGVPTIYLLLALITVMPQLVLGYLRNLYLGMERIEEFNLVSILQSAAGLILAAIALGLLDAGVVGLIVGGIVVAVTLAVMLSWHTYKTLGGISLRVNPAYMKEATAYGFQTYITNTLAFLNYRLDLLLVNTFLDPLAVGYYSTAAAIGEKLWIASQAAGTVLFPRIAAQKGDSERGAITPIVSRNILLLSALAASVLYVLSRPLVLLLYSADYLPTVRPLRILLPGIVTLGVGRVLATDIAGRGRPMLNGYVNLAAVATNVVLNLLWLPRFGLDGAAWSSTVSYTVLMIGQVLVYARISRTSPLDVLLPRASDLLLYRRVGRAVLRRAARLGATFRSRL